MPRRILSSISSKVFCVPSVAWGRIFAVSKLQHSIGAEYDVTMELYMGGGYSRLHHSARRFCAHWH